MTPIQQALFATRLGIYLQRIVMEAKHEHAVMMAIEDAPRIAEDLSRGLRPEFVQVICDHGDLVDDGSNSPFRAPVATPDEPTNSVNLPAIRTRDFYTKEGLRESAFADDCWYAVLTEPEFESLCSEIERLRRDRAARRVEGT